MKIELTIPQEFQQEYEDILRKLIREELANVTIKEVPSLQTKDDIALLTRKEAMELIKCSHSTLYRYQKEGVVPYIKVGKKVLFEKGPLLESIRILGKQ